MKKILKSYNIFTIVCAVFVLLTVICTPIFGVGDMSEYTSTFESVGLYNSHDATWAISQSYGIGEPDGSAKSVFQIFLMGLIGFNKLIFSKTVFNIHFLSVVYSVIFLIGIYFLQKNVNFQKGYLSYAFSALLALVFLDFGYLTYFNSFYTDALIFVLIIALAAVAVAMVNKFSYIKLALYAICACLLSAMRFAEGVAALAAGVALLMLALSFKGKGKAAAIAVAAVISAVSVVAMFNSYVPAAPVKLYNLIYNDFAQDSDTALEYFGLEEAALENPTIDQMSEAVKGITYGDVVRYYMDNPAKLGANIKSAANNSYFLIQDYAVYREEGAYYGLREGTSLKIWNTLKKRVLPVGVWVILGFIVIYGAVAIREYLRHKKSGSAAHSGMALFALVLPVGALAELLGTVITTGRILVGRNMFVFGVYFDLMLITALLWAAATLIARQEAIKTKYGVNQ